MPLSEAQIAQRRGGVCATDIAPILGLNPWKCAHDVLSEKRGHAPAEIQNRERVRWGELVEPVVLRRYAEQHGVYVDDTYETIVHPGDPIAMATPDGIVLDANSRPRTGLEVKTHSFWLSHLYGAPNTDQMPIWEILQCAWNLYVARGFFGAAMESWDLVVVIDNLPRRYVYRRDAELESLIASAARDFYKRHVECGLPIPIDGSESCKAWLKRRFSRHTEEWLDVDSGSDEHATIVDFLRERQCCADATERLGAAKNRLRALIGSHFAVRWREGGNPRVITYKKTRDKDKTEWDLVAAEYRQQLELVASTRPELRDSIVSAIAEIQSKHTKTVPGHRVLRVLGEPDEVDDDKARQ